MYVCSLSRRRNHKQKVGQGAVKGVVINALRNHHGRQSGLLYRLYLCVRNGNSLTDGRAAQGFPSQYALLISGGVLKPSSGIHQGYQPVHGLLLI